MAQSAAEKNHASKISKNKPKCISPIPTPTTPPKDIFSSRKHSMDYVTVEGVVLRTGYADKKDWYLLCIKELLDNGTDFLWKNYQGASDAAITVDITKTNNSLLHINVRNTNSRNIPVFQNLSLIFDYDMRYGSKQNQHIISRGMLGDAMKQILAWPYVLIHANDDGSAFTDIQWNEPLIIRSNKIERQVFLHVDRGNQSIHADPIKESPIELPSTDTEIELTWPITDDVHLDIHTIEAFCRIYPILTTDISFKFRLVDNSKDQPNDEADGSGGEYHYVRSNKFENASQELVKVLVAPARKAAINIDHPALHPISTGWNNISSIGSYKPEEFVSAFTSVYDKESTQVYDVLRTVREGNMMKKSADNQISIAELMLDPNKEKKIETLYHELKNALDPPKNLSLPYNNKIKDVRRQALIERIMQLYPGQLDDKKAFYKVFPGFYNGGVLHYPFAIEIVAIPFNDKVLSGNTQPTQT